MKKITEEIPNIEEWKVDFPSEEEVEKRKQIYYSQKRMEDLKTIVPPAFAETIIGRLPHKQVRAALDWSNDEEGKLNLCLAGKTGVGKTRSAWEAMKNRYMKFGARPMAIGAETFTRRLFREPHLMDQVCSVPLLLLDDLGKEKTTPTAESAIFEVVRERMDRKMSTIYTTNFSPSTLIERFQQKETGEAIARRLKESSLSIVFE
jgi:DNA replication protein DnaC